MSHIVISLGSCALASILASLHPHVRVYSLVSSHPYILISSGSCARTCIPASSYTQIRMCLLLTSYVLFVLAGTLAFSHPHILTFMYSGCLLVSSHHDILISLRSCTPVACWYPRILTSSYLYVHELWVLVGFLSSSHPRILRFQCSYLFRKLKSDKNNDSKKKPELLWKQIMALTNI